MSPHSTSHSSQLAGESGPESKNRLSSLRAQESPQNRHRPFFNVVWALAVNTFKEAVRNKILYALIFFSLGIMMLAIILDEVTIGQRSKIITDIGLASINIFGVIIAIVIGINLVYKEIEKKTIYPILAKPVHRYQFIIGKYLGILLTLAVETIIMSSFLFSLVWFYEETTKIHTLNVGLLSGIFLIYIELAVVAAIAMFFSSFSTPFLSGMFTFSCYVIGHLTEDLKRLGEVSGNEVLKGVTSAFYHILPNLENFNIKAEVVHHLPIENGRIVLSILYGMLYIVLSLTLASWFFQRRDFK